MLRKIIPNTMPVSGEAKKKIPGYSFSEKLVLDNGKVATTPFNLPIQIILNVSQV